MHTFTLRKSLVFLCMVTMTQLIPVVTHAASRSDFISSAKSTTSSNSSTQKQSLKFLTGRKRASSGSRSAKSDATCAGSPVKEFGSGSVCADSGFRLKDVLTFENWGGTGRYKEDEYLGPEFIATFGEDNVCASVSGGRCTLTQSAAEAYTQISKYISGGRCEGMVVVAGLMSLGRIRPHEVASGTKTVAAISPSVPDVLRAVNYWWTTQFSSEVVSATAEIKEKGVSEIVRLLGSNLRNGVYATMGLYSGRDGHAVLPVALTRENSGAYVAIVYDSNASSSFGRVELDTVADAWRYRAPGLGGSPQGWMGRSGTIDLTPMLSRQRSVKCDFCGGKSPSSLSVSIGTGRIVTAADLSR